MQRVETHRTGCLSRCQWHVGRLGPANFRGHANSRAASSLDFRDAVRELIGSESPTPCSRTNVRGNGVREALMNTSSRRKLAAAVVGMVVVGSSMLTGCGGDEETAEPTAEGGTKTSEAERAPSDETGDDAPSDADEPAAPTDEDPWSVTAGSYDDDAHFEFDCPPGGSVEYEIWGGVDGNYTDDSSICVSAVHAGLISAEDGGTVTVQIVPGLETYGDGFEANGVTSLAWTIPWARSITFP
jgi:hypothetical protein